MNSSDQVVVMVGGSEGEQEEEGEGEGGREREWREARKGRYLISW